MCTIFANIHLQGIQNEILPLSNVDLDKNYAYLKELIAKELKHEDIDFELFYNSRALGDDLQQLSAVIKPNAIVHCFRKKEKYTPYKPPESVDIRQVQEDLMFAAETQISISARVIVMAKVFRKYPGFLRNLGALFLMFDSLLFNSLHDPSTVENLAKHYPLICDAAHFLMISMMSFQIVSEQAASDVPTSFVKENPIDASDSTSSETNSSSTNLPDDLPNA